MEEKNAKIKSTQLGTADHGIFTYFIHLDYGGAGQGFGGYGLDKPVFEGDRFSCRRGTAYGCEAIRRLLETLRVKAWEDLPGTPCRVRAEHSKVHAIGHLLEDRWLSLKELADEMVE